STRRFARTGKSSRSSSAPSTSPPARRASTCPRTRDRSRRSDCCIGGSRQNRGLSRCDGQVVGIARQTWSRRGTGGDPMPYETILSETAGTVATITLNRPDTLNAINPQMTAELHQALDAAEMDGAVRAIVLTGSGRAFSAGYDIARRPDGRSSLDPTGVEMAEFLKRWWTNDGDATQRLLHLWNMSKPVIAAVHGWVMGGGFWYSLACDITIAAD